MMMTQKRDGSEFEAWVIELVDVPCHDIFSKNKKKEVPLFKRKRY